MNTSARAVGAAVLGLSLLGSALSLPAHAGERAGAPARVQALRDDGTDRLIIRLRDLVASDPDQRIREVSGRTGEAVRRLRSLSGGGHVVQLPARMSATAARAVARRLAGDAAVAYAEPDLRVHPQRVPNDSLYPQQWHYFDPVGGINLPAAWDVTTGDAGLVVAVLDTGIVGHADLAARLVPGYDFIADVAVANDGNGRDGDAGDPGDYGCDGAASSWHGTHVAGTVGAATNNGSGVAGVNWTSRVQSIRVLGRCGGYTSDVDRRHPLGGRHRRRRHAGQPDAGARAQHELRRRGRLRHEPAERDQRRHRARHRRRRRGGQQQRRRVDLHAGRVRGRDRRRRDRPQRREGELQQPRHSRRHRRAGRRRQRHPLDVEQWQHDAGRRLVRGLPGHEHGLASRRRRRLADAVGQSGADAGAGAAEAAVVGAGVPVGTGNDCRTTTCGAGIVDAAAAIGTPTTPLPPPTGRANLALASAGAQATASSTYSASYPPSGVINGDRRGSNWAAGGGWNDATPGAWPAWLQVDLGAVRTVAEIDVFTVQDAYANPQEPTEALTFSRYGITDFEVQTWTGLAWQTVPGGSVTGNNRVWRRFAFPAVSTRFIRVLIVGSTDGFSRLTEVEAYATADATPPPSPAGAVNVAAQANGGVATASSAYAGYPAAAVNNGDRRGLSWGSGGGWNDATGNNWPDAVQIDFNGAKGITEIDVFTIQDAYANPQEPTEASTFGQYGATDFDLQYWTGSAWAAVPGGSIRGNDKVWRKVTFAAITTSAVRVVVLGGLAGYSRLVEVEAWGTPVAGATTNVAAQASGGSATASSAYAGYPAAAVNNGDRRGINWGAGGGWNDATGSSWPDFVQIDFSGVKSIVAIDVFTVQDAYASPQEPTDTLTFSQYGITDFDLQYWTGSAWAAVPAAAYAATTRCGARSRSRPSRPARSVSSCSAGWPATAASSRSRRTRRSASRGSAGARSSAARPLSAARTSAARSAPRASAGRRCTARGTDRARPPSAPRSSRRRPACAVPAPRPRLRGRAWARRRA